MIRFLFPRFTARRRYFAASALAAQAWAEFTAPGDTWVSRWNALRDMADSVRTIAETVSGFPHAGERDENGFTLAESNAFGAELLELVAGTEIRTGRRGARGDRMRLLRADRPVDAGRVGYPSTGGDGS